MDNQQKVWNSIAKDWNKFRVKTVEEVQEFLKAKNGNVLDLGCGAGRNFVRIQGTIYGVDFSEKMLKYSKEYADKNDIKVKLFNSDLIELPFKDNFFDAGIFVAVLHCISHEEDREKSLRELLRVLKPNAEALISVWDYDQEKFKNKEKESFISWRYKGKKYQRYSYLYEKDEFLDLLKKTDFNILKVMDKSNPFGLYSKRNIIAIVRKK